MTAPDELASRAVADASFNREPLPKVLFFGNFAIDIAYRLDCFPGPNEKMLAMETRLSSGGSATNAAKTFGAMGGQAVLAVTLGSCCFDQDWLIQSTVKYGVDLIDLARSPFVSPVVAVFVSRDTGDRACVWCPSDIPKLSESVVNDLDLDGVDAVLVDGYHPDAAAALMTRARERAIKTVLDGGTWKPTTARLLPLADWAICSEAFALDGSARSPIETVDLLLKAGAHGAAVTLGEDGAVWREAGRQGSVGSPVPTEVIDTTGAGDVLHAVVCLAACRGATLEDALQFGTQVASDSCESFGLDPWLDRLMSDPTHLQRLGVYRPDATRP